ncbi:MAG TPA: glutamine--fructose-6-phosphate transaminase (isomerizing) [Porticoccaceae bacterium]|nr:glutamine--fructose-6-phosphate transaminase (isomerizing) [Porticoccaceae bacterium]
MCGIVGAAAQRNVRGILLEGLRRLEYRGYDSAGLALLTDDKHLHCVKKQGKVEELVRSAEQEYEGGDLTGSLGIAHTRWATHGIPSEVNAHPHLSDEIAVVHNGIIENHEILRAELQGQGYGFISDTDSEVIAHLIHACYQRAQNLALAVKQAVARLEGAYALAVIHTGSPDELVGTRHGSPLVLGVGIEENFLASDPLALRQVTDRFIYLEEGDVVTLSARGYHITDMDDRPAKRQVVSLSDRADQADKGGYRHYMLKEIYQQPEVLEATLQGRVSNQHVLPEAFGEQAPALLKQVECVHIIACGTSYHAGLVARYWFESWAGIPCQVEVASEYRYRTVVVPDNTLFVSISQSGETADTLAALKAARQQGYLASLTICNVANSSLVRESDLALMTQAGPEIGVASTKAFTTQLVALQLLGITLARYRGKLSGAKERELVEALHQLPALCQQVLALDARIEHTFESFADKHHALFLGRGVQYPIALEGALKLKEISYIHAEAYPSGELKHGPLALVDADMPVIAVAPNDDLLEKLKSNLHEVQARGGRLYVFADAAAGFHSQDGVTVLEIPHVPPSVEAIIYTLPLQLLAYHVAVLKGTDVDQPRNLAKSVTVE